MHGRAFCMRRMAWIRGWPRTHPGHPWIRGWPGSAVGLEQMRKDVGRYVANCHTCRRIKLRHHAPYGALLSLPVPGLRWQGLWASWLDCQNPTASTRSGPWWIDYLSKRTWFRVPPSLLRAPPSFSWTTFQAL